MIPHQILIITVEACEAILQEKGFMISRPPVIDEQYLHFLVNCLNALNIDRELKRNLRFPKIHFHRVPTKPRK